MKHVHNFAIVQIKSIVPFLTHIHSTHQPYLAQVSHSSTKKNRQLHFNAYESNAAVFVKVLETSFLRITTPLLLSPTAASSLYAGMCLAWTSERISSSDNWDGPA